MATSPAKRIAQLRDELNQHNYHYYVEAKPAISDREYDGLMQELTELEAIHPEFLTPDSPSQRVGGQPIEGFATIEHAVPMMSIDNTYNQEAVRAFAARVTKALNGEAHRYVLEPKIDGVAATLRYEQGLLQLAARRGDGRRGDDITQHARTIHSIPLRLQGKLDPPRILEVRGEVYMTNDVFQNLNRKREAAGEETYKNPRNLTTGALTQLDPKITASRQLRFICHGLGQVEPLATDSYWEWLKLLRQWRLPVAEHVRLANDVDEVLAEIKSFELVRGTLPYQTDGMVVKIDSFQQRQRLGVTSKAPRWVIAYKYQAEQTQTILKDVDWQVGKGGTLTPVARMEPIFLAGTTVQNATLHNMDQIRKLDLHLGDTIVLEKAGEVIPYVRQAVVEKRPRGAKPIHPPTTCPSCGTKVHKELDGPYIRCPNPDCPAQFRERLKWFCGRNQMDIENVGEKLADQLVDAGIVKTFADLYRLSAPQLMELERMGEKSAQNVVEAIDKSRDCSLDRLLAGLGIHHVGNRVAYVLATQFKSIEALEAASMDQLAQTPEIGPVVAKSVYEFFHAAAGRHAIEELKKVGIDPRMAPIAAPAGQPLQGQSVVVTGTLAHFKRDEIEALIIKHGGRAAGSVSKKTSFVVAGADAGSKLDKARQVGVPVLSEEQFMAKIGMNR